MPERNNTIYTIMIVDDTPANLRLLENMLRRKGYRVLAFPKGALALRGALATPPDLILLDINMPEMNGYEVCESLKNEPSLADIPVLFLSALNESEDKTRAFAVGGVDYITKPFQIEEVLARVQTHLQLREMRHTLEIYNRDLEERIQKQVREISEAQISTIIALAKLAEERDGDTGKHIERVRLHCRSLARALQKSSPYAREIDEAFVENIYHASALHDIGKVGIKDSILQKPGVLSPEEYGEIKRHPLIGARTLQTVQEAYPNNTFIGMGIEITRSHHERWDGQGYPDGLVGEAIPLSARIMAVADVYDALRMERCYKPAFPHDRAVAIIQEGRGTQFDPVVVDAFLELGETFRQRVDTFR